MAKVRIKARAAIGGEALPWAWVSTSSGMVSDRSLARLVDPADVDGHIRDLRAANPGWEFEPETDAGAG